MKKFVIATSIPEDSKYVDNKKITELVAKTFASGNNIPKDIVVMNLNNVSKEALDKFIELGSIDCFVFTPEILKNSENLDVIKKVMKTEIELNTNIKLLNVYNSQNEENIQNSVNLGNLMLDDKFNSNLLHFDINSDERIICQNLRGIKNDAIKSRELLMKREADILGLIGNIVDRIDTEKDEYTSKHIRSVCAISEQIAIKMNMTKEEIELIKIGALLHDIGKIDVRDNVLKKPSGLTDNEFHEMSMHVTFGEIELNEFDLGKYERAKLVASEHHEKYNGKGYPRGLKGEEIDVFSRIVSIADATQAMFGRSYQSGRTKDSLIEELKKCSGVQFDPQMVDILCDILDKEPESIGVSYNVQGEITYKTKETSELLQREPSELDKNSFLAGLKSGVSDNIQNNSSKNDNQLKNKQIDDNII